MLRTNSVASGDWRTLEWSWNDPGTVFFRDPAAAQIKLRYGDGPWVGFDGQKQTLDGSPYKIVTWGRLSLLFVRVQIKVGRDTRVTYDIYAGEFGKTYPDNPF